MLKEVRIQIMVQLIEAETDRHLWAENYERDFRDVLLLQKEVALAITNEIKIKLTPQDEERLSEAQPVNLEAFELYLRGRDLLNTGND